MWKSGTFDLKDINETLLEEIVFFDICYPGMGNPGCVIFITQYGDEYIISQRGTDWSVDKMVKLFPEMYEVYSNQKNGTKDEYGFKNIGNWKIIPEFGGIFLVRKDYFEKFYSIYQRECKSNKEFPCSVARLLFGKEAYVPKERMVYRKTQECWDRDLQEAIAREREVEENRLTDKDIPWMKYQSHILEGYIKFWIRQNEDGTFSGFRWLIQVQKEEFEEGGYKPDAPIECYNLFFQKYESIDISEMANFEKYIKYCKAGEFVRSYKTLEKAKEAVAIRNEWSGWGNVNKKNVYMIDYEYLKRQIKEDKEIFIF